jgi:hypothetical protein
MYPYDYSPKSMGIDHAEIFVVMPFHEKFDTVFSDLICPAAKRTNRKMGYTNHSLFLRAHRTKEDIRTTSGWMNVLEHLFTAQIVIGVLDTNNSNVFYELGIAHATQPITRQILIASKGYKPKFDTKDLILFRYDRTNLASYVEPLSLRIVESLKQYRIDQEKRVKQARMPIGPFDFEVIMFHGKERNFAVHSNKPDWIIKYEKIYGLGSFERHIAGISNLCKIGLLGLNTQPKLDHTRRGVEFSYWWTGLGNDVLHLMGIIDNAEVKRRRLNLPDFFEK